MKRSKTSIAWMALPLLALVALSWGCKERGPDSPEGRTNWYQCLWDGGPNDFSPYAEFKAGGVLVHHDDTATIQGTWTSVEETVEWTLQNPPKNTKFRGFWDDEGMSGTMEDDLGHTGIFQGSKW